MSVPRAVLPGRCYMITRRCSERRLFMRPDPDTNNAFVYCLAYAAERTGVRIIFYLAMSNHYHAGVLDTDGRLPRFLEYFHRLFAKHQNVLRGRWENFWATEQTSVVELVEPEDVVEKMIYALGNPVKDDLVETSREWPGASSLAAQMSDEPIRAFRPRRFFSADGPMPDEMTIRLARPPGLESMSAVAFREWIAERLKQWETDAADRRARGGKRVLGPEAVVKQPWWGHPSTREPRRRLNPKVACRNVWARIEALARNKAFIAAYRCARERLLAGLEAKLPVGTYWLRVYAGLPCETS
jgi:putative transposase